MPQFKIRSNALFMRRLRVGSSGSYTQIDNDGDITQVGTAATSLGNFYSAAGCFAAASFGGKTNQTVISSIGNISQGGAASAALGDVTTGCAVITEASFGGATNKTVISSIGNITQAGAASAALGDVTTGCAVITEASFGGTTNKTILSSIGNIAQYGAASAALGDVTTACLQVGSGTEIQNIMFGSFTPCFNQADAGVLATGSGTVTGITTSHKVIVCACAAIGAACAHLVAVCPLADSIKLSILIDGTGNMDASSTCPWSYIAFK